MVVALMRLNEKVVQEVDLGAFMVPLFLLPFHYLSE